MPTFQAIQIFIFLIPGFISARLLDALIVRGEKQKELESIVEALIFSMLIYTFYSFTGEKSPVTMDTQNSAFSFSYNSTSFLWLIGISLLLPILLGLIINNDIHTKILRWVKVTRRTSRHSVWYDAFYENSNWLVIDFKDGKRLLGWAKYFSDLPDKPFIYLADPKWIDKENKYVETNLEGILITPAQEISFIEFVKANDLKSIKKEGKNGTK